MRVALLLGGWLLAADLAAQDHLIALEPAQIERLGIELVTPKPVREIPRGQVPATVTVPPQAEFAVSAPVAGMIEEVLVARGEFVAAGQRLARINGPELLAYQQRLLDAWQEFKLAQANYQRDQVLFQEGVIAKRRWLESQKLYQQARIALAQARQELRLLGMTQAAIEHLLAASELDGRVDLVAPTAGIVTDRLAMAGQRVDRQQRLFQLASVKELWLEMAVPVARAGHLRLGARVVAEPHGASGKITLLGGAVDPATQTILVRAKLTEPRGLRLGQKVTVALFEEVAQGFKLPRSALVEHEDKWLVFVRTQQGFQVTPIQVAAMTEESVFVTGSLDPAAQIASQGVAALKAAWLGVGED